MNYLKKIIISLGFSFIIFFISSFLFTFLQYINWLSPTILTVFFTISTIISFFIGGFIFGKKSLKKGWLEGIKLSFIQIIIILLVNLLISNMQIKNIIFYIILFISTTFGSIVGVNRKKG